VFKSAWPASEQVPFIKRTLRHLNERLETICL